nr:MAG TPA: hypothetical protein [Caudoviricetes sp.]
MLNLSITGNIFYWYTFAIIKHNRKIEEGQLPGIFYLIVLGLDRVQTILF